MRTTSSKVPRRGIGRRSAEVRGHVVAGGSRRSLSASWCEVHEAAGRQRTCLVDQRSTCDHGVGYEAVAAIRDIPERPACGGKW